MRSSIAPLGSGTCWTFVLGVLASCAAHAFAQPSVSLLHPAGASDSQAFAVARGGAAGNVKVNGTQRAALWDSIGWIDLSPTGATGSGVLGLGRAQQVGYVVSGGTERAALWNGTAASMASLHPAAAYSSFAAATDGVQQVGWTTGGGGFNAVMWSSTADSCVVLSPPGSTQAEARGVAHGMQVGYARINNSPRASLWHGSAASWVNLQPAAATQSFALGTDGRQQVGRALADGMWRASLWEGGAATWVNLHPDDSGFSSSEATAVWGGMQVGYVAGSGSRASLWYGTSESRIDLSQFLPMDLAGWSVATGISPAGANVRISGYCLHRPSSRWMAVVWTLPRCVGDVDDDGDPNNGTMPDGAVTIDDLLAFLFGFETGNIAMDLDNGTSTGIPDGAVDIDDLLYFLARFEAGC